MSACRKNTWEKSRSEITMSILRDRPEDKEIAYGYIESLSKDCVLRHGFR